MWVREVCVFGVQDLPLIVNRPELFANKFYADYQPVALQCLWRYIQYKTLCPVELDLQYYRNLNFINK